MLKTTKEASSKKKKKKTHTHIKTQPCRKEYNDMPCLSDKKKTLSAGEKEFFALPKNFEKKSASKKSGNPQKIMQNVYV